MAEVIMDVLRAQVVRHNVNQNWGFRLEGGADYGTPLQILRVTPASPADKIGVSAGDLVTEIGDIPTEGLTLQQAQDIVADFGDTILLTLERRARGAVPVNPVLAHKTVDGQDAIKQYQPLNMSGGGGGRKFNIVQSQPFHNTGPRVVAAPPQSGVQLIETPPPTSPTAHYQQQPAAQPSYETRYYQEDPYAPQPPQPSMQAPQSRTFQTIQNVMQYDDNPVMLARITNNQKAGTGPSLLNKQYNTPVALYSNDNVKDSFLGQMKAMSLSETDSSSNPQKRALTPETLRLVHEMDEHGETEPIRTSTSTGLQQSSIHVNIGANSNTAEVKQEVPPGYNVYEGTTEQKPQQEESRTYTSSITLQPVQKITNNNDMSGPDVKAPLHISAPNQNSAHNDSPMRVTTKKKVSRYAAINKYLPDESDSAIENTEFEYHGPVVGNVKTYLEEKQSIDETSTDSGVDSVDDAGPVKSKSFKRLQQMLDECDGKSVPSAGSAGLPPQRSVHMERFREEQAAQRAGSPRMRVLRAQQYNNPMQLYSAGNVMDTFQTQTSALLEEINKRDQQQGYSGPSATSF